MIFFRLSGEVFAAQKSTYAQIISCPRSDLFVLVFNGLVVCLPISQYT